ncbi:MAG: transcription-repair coupling factor [Bacteroidaceae bacterium]|nr:transcription-repair coupling factor [Bacteroidaceae bacterium]
MNADGLLALFSRHSQVKALRRVLADGSLSPVFLENLQGSSPALVFAALELSSSVLFVLNDEDEAGYFYHDLVQLMGEQRVLFFPSAFRRAVKYGQRDAANEILRTEVLSRLSSDSPSLFIVTFPEALASKVVEQETLSARSLRVRVGDSYDLSDLEHQLLDLGMHRTDYVYEPGDFALRGSILDVFSFSSELPYRLDFFGDELDSIRTFNVESQLSESRKDEAVIVPAVDEQSVGRVSLLHFLPQGSLTVWRSPQYVTEAVGRIYEEGFTQQALIEMTSTSATGMSEAELNGKMKKLFLLRSDELKTESQAFRQVILGYRPDRMAGTRLKFQTSPQPLFHKNFDLLADSLAGSIAEGYKVYILADSEKQNERLRDIFDEINSRVLFTPVRRTLHAGFVDDNLRVCVFTDHQIFDRFHKYNLKSDRARSGKVALSLKELNQFEPGDYVTHVDHGIGQFVGLVHVVTGGVEQEVMKLIYHGNDVVYVSIHSLNKVSKYKGSEGEAPRLNRLGGGAWEKLKDRTKKKIKDIARDLIRLYAQRRQEKGFAFSADSYMQHELEASFLYEDTPDQLRVTQEVKHDMESQRPMDRLVCGDVGFGKTEIAVRAAFKAATDGKQVAVLVPTTVLAYQHYHTFCDRLKDFPVRVEYLSRARSAAKAKEIKDGLKNGQVEIVIGTHMLISKTVQFKDLGLLIIDEEQKFGVAVKEKLRQLRVNVDTLTMSATPIPRTLQFSLMGARDLSVLQTPPPNRYPIRTEIHRFGHEVIADAINFELSRNGQVFFVCNRIAKLAEVEKLILKHVPDARVAIGHGQMPPEALEKIVMGFINHDFDVLLSTTIVENGIDIPNANTIIIDNADHFGLSDLHQMRGRVGRGNRKAFCYLLAPPLADLPSDARRRLEAVENFSELGSGIQIAMQDLDIRGAGNLLGAEQSGFIADLGYETYQKILTEAVTELRNDEFSELYADDTQTTNELKGDLFVDDCTIDTDLPLYLPEEYIPGSAERMACYRELDSLQTEEQLETFKQRLVDRFGAIPQVGLDLMNIVPLRRLGRSLGMERILLKNGQMMLYFVSNPDSAFYRSATFGRSLAYITHNLRRCTLGEVKQKRRMVVKAVPTATEALQVLRDMAAMEPD